MHEVRIKVTVEVKLRKGIDDRVIVGAWAMAGVGARVNFGVRIWTRLR